MVVIIIRVNGLIHLKCVHSNNKSNNKMTTTTTQPQIVINNSYLALTLCQEPC